MNLETIQPAAQEALKRIFEVQAADVPVLLDDGTYPKTDGREQYLREVGFCIIVTPVNAIGLLDQARGGLSSIDVGFHVIVEENVSVNRGPTGHKLEPEKAARLIMQGLCGRPTVSVPNQPNSDAPFHPFRLDDPPFQNFGTTGGLRQIVVNFAVKCIITPTNKDPQ